MNTSTLVNPQVELEGRIEASKIAQVRDVFENSSHYLTRRGVDIQLRVETVRTFASRSEWSRLLDIGCGDGSITAPLLHESSQATMLDCSASMCDLAKNQIPAACRARVDVRNEDFSDAALGAAAFDLIVTVGVMAHVDSPAAFLKKIKGHLRPDGRLILEFTDAYHPVGRIGRAWSWLKEMLAPPRYTTNKLSARAVKALITESGFQVIAEYRYSRIPLPGVDRLVSRRLQYALVKLIFGDCTRSRFSFLGNEHICLLQPV